MKTYQFSFYNPQQTTRGKTYTVNANSYAEAAIKGVKTYDLELNDEDHCENGDEVRVVVNLYEPDNESYVFQIRAYTAPTYEILDSYTL